MRMPHKKLGDENAAARRRVSTRSGAVAPNHSNITGAKSMLSKNIHHSSNERRFARDIKNISRRPPIAAASTADVELRLEQANIFNQLAAEFGTLNLTSDVAHNAVTLSGNACFDSEVLEIQPATLFSRDAFSGSSSGDRPGDGIKSRSASRTHSLSTNLPYLKVPRNDRSSIDAMKRSSFRSASIVSQSTPLLGKTGRRSIRPFRPLDDNSEIYSRYSLGSNSQQLHTVEADAGYQLVESGRGSTQAIDSCNDDELMRQLASQLSEVALSPCITPVPDNDVEASLEELADVPQERPNTSLKGRAGSFSLGFIPFAFPEEIDIKDLRISV